MELDQQLLSVIAFLVAILVGVVGWIGKRVFERMDSIQGLLRQAERDIHVRINNHETRITRVEARHESAQRAH